MAYSSYPSRFFRYIDALDNVLAAEKKETYKNTSKKGGE